MAGLRMKAFQVQVFRTLSLADVEPVADVEVQALTEVSAVMRVLREYGLTVAGVVYIACGEQAVWLYEVSVAEGQVAYGGRITGMACH